MEKAVTFDAHGLLLEGLLYEGHCEKGAIITHPHPLYGGDMDNPVVAALGQSYQEIGWSTLRFNFRGTGQSQGDFDNGIGEQDDVQAAIDFFQARDVGQIELAGYSFGAWVLAGWSQQFNQPGHPIVLVSPPVAFMEFPPGPLPGLRGIIAGQHDELGPPDQIQDRLPEWHPDAKLTTIENADHFFQGRLDNLQQVFIKMSGNACGAT